MASGWRPGDGWGRSSRGGLELQSVGSAGARMVMQLLNRCQEAAERLRSLVARIRLCPSYSRGLMVSAIGVVQNEGWSSLFFKAKARIRQRNLVSGTDRYRVWIARNEAHGEELQRSLVACRQECASFHYKPKLSIVTPVWNTDRRWLRLAIESVITQVYDNWEMCIADGGSTEPGLVEVLEDYARRDPRIKVKFLPKNKGISGNSNEALSLAAGEFVGFLDHDDELSPFALYEVVRLLNQDASVDFIYSDEDRIDVKGHRYLPFFKPDWSPDLLLSYMYTGHFTVYRRRLVQDLGGFRSVYDLSQDYDLALRAAEKAKEIAHVPKVLYHWRAAAGSAASGGKKSSRATNIAALASAVVRRGYDATAVMIRPKWGNRIQYNVAKPPMISIVIPTEKETNARRCVDGVLKKGAYPRFEVVMVANSRLANTLRKYYGRDSRVRFAASDEESGSSARRNLGASCAMGDYILFMSDDVVALEDSWLEEMVQLFQRAEIGAVGARLISSDNAIVHAGLATGVRGLVGAPFRHHHRDSLFYFHYTQNTRDVSALSASCLLVPRQILETVGGFNEINTPTAFSDVDLCFRIRERVPAGLYTVRHSYAVLQFFNR